MTEKLEVWEGAVHNVIALASQADVAMETTSDGGVQITNPVFESGPNITRKITRAQVEKWVQRVMGQTYATLHRMRRLSEETRKGFAPAFANAVELGAAAYLVDAAYPQRAGVNDQASYGDVLWTRHRQAVADLEEAIAGAWKDESSGGGPTPAGGPAGGRRPPIFTDEWVTENHPGLEATPYGAPGTELPTRFRW